MHKLSFMGAANYRTYFYLKALKEHNIALNQVYIYDNKPLDITRIKDKVLEYNNFKIKLDVSLDTLLEFFKAEIFQETSINQLEKHVKSLESNIVIFSGKGGEIVHENILQYKKFLHVHPGKLPSYRGSTTIYYSLLQESRCYATAFFLEKSIDTGNIIKEMEFDILDMDFDYLYDPFIRSYLLVDVLKNNQFEAFIQASNNQKEYYIIHPVLKKLALIKKDKMYEKSI